MRVAIYIRVSTLDQAREGYSLSAQRSLGIESPDTKCGRSVQYLEPAGEISLRAGQPYRVF